MSYRPQHFVIKELVPPETFAELGEDRCWSLLDERMLRTLDALREKFGAVVVNDWHNGGDLRYCGFRPDGCQIGAKHSQHRYGRAADCHFVYISASDVRAYVLAHRNEFPFVAAVEDGTAWFHFDVRNVEAIQIFTQ